ncbi:hypothetical protein N7522_006353 [Penicillium canescens]|nr:hypothetical protein N7522_006353 [Penicillium canescens]
MGIQRTKAHGGSQRYIDRMTRLLSSGSPEPKNTGSPPTSIVGSEDDDCYSQTDGSDDDGKATFLFERSDGEETQGQRAKERVKERPLGGVRCVKCLKPEYLTESMEKMIECMTESNAYSLTGQDLWN